MNDRPKADGMIEIQWSSELGPMPEYFEVVALDSGRYYGAPRPKPTRWQRHKAWWCSIGRVWQYTLLCWAIGIAIGVALGR